MQFIKVDHRGYVSHILHAAGHSGGGLRDEWLEVPGGLPPRPEREGVLFNVAAWAWEDEPVNAEERAAGLWAAARERRAALLTQSDWTQVTDAPLSPEARRLWAQYRQALRDITLQPDPANIVWPTPPG